MVLVVVIYMVVANHTIFSMVGRYQIYVVYLITLPDILTVFYANLGIQH